VPAVMDHRVLVGRLLEVDLDNRLGHCQLLLLVVPAFT
jgi:hypothetical protein